MNKLTVVNLAYKGIMLVLLILIIVIVVSSATAYEFETATLYAFRGVSVSNSVTDQKSGAWSLEQKTPTRYGTWLFGYLNEGSKESDKRDGIYALRNFNYQFSPSFETSFATGPYFTATTITEQNKLNYQDHYSWAGLAEASANYALNKQLSLQVRWGHVIYAEQNKDADLFLFGIGFIPTSW